MKRIYIIAATALALVVVGLAASRHLSGRHSDKMFKTEMPITGNVSEKNSNKPIQDISKKSQMKDSHATNDSKTFTPLKVQIYTSKQDIGHIGISDGKTSDNPEDNIFEVVLPENVPDDAKVWLAYDLYGINSGSGVSRGINDRPSTGGYQTKISNKWTPVCEEISPSWLHKGTNRILFTTAENMPAYSVRNLRIKITGGNNEIIALALSPVSYGNKTYIHGFTDKSVREIKAGKEQLNLTDGEFEGIISTDTENITITATKSDGSRIVKTFTIEDGGKADFNREYTAYAPSETNKNFSKNKADSMSVSGGQLKVEKDVMLNNLNLSVRTLRETDVPSLDFGMTNVTAEGEGYRFLPHGNHFTDEGATVKIKYDRTRIPSGYTEDDIRTYYFDLDTRHWVALERIKVDKTSACIVSKTTHFTDMINGVIQAPESPETEGFAPTMMNDIKAADPTAKINIITPPTANSRGTANLQYTFEMPPARNGMTPNLGIQYNSDGGNGWLGEGWNMPMPSITIDTRWGVPRYDTAKETETYLLSGAMLSTMDDGGKMGVAHRGEKMNRKTDRQFYTRQGGDFQRIIRKGSSPADYYWEVTDNQGVKYIYGGEGAVLKGTVKDINGISRNVISEWKLARVEETHGDYIEYVYETADENIRGNLKAKAIYLKEVHAGNAGQEPHTVVVFDCNKTKQIKSNNARYGFLTSSNRLLEKVTVNFRGQELRSYAFSYQSGAFSKDLLESVRQYDNEGNEVSYQNFGYYNDVKTEGGYAPFQSRSEKWNLSDDKLDAGFVNPLQSTDRFSDKPTALGGTTSSSTSVSFYAGVGVADNSPWKGNTVGGSYSYSTDNSKGLSAFVDINGDGLPDKIFRKNGALYYRPQLRSSGNNNITYGEPIKVAGINSFSTVKSSTNTGGAKATVGWMALTAEVGTDFVKTKTQTTEYFSDINGDGLVDLVSNGKVYFNHIEFDANGNAIPTFTESSADTPSPIIYSGKIDTSVITVSPEEQQEAIDASPMEDIVRVWQAPKDGMVIISSKVRLLEPTGEYDTEEYAKADGVYVSIQKGNTVHWSQSIDKDDRTWHNKLITNLRISKGDRIYFRVQSGRSLTSNGSFDRVEWSPTITYFAISDTLPNGYSTTVYKPEEGAIYSVNTLTSLSGWPSFKVKGTFSKPQTTDDVTLRIIGSNDPKDANGNDNPNYVEKEVFCKTYTASEIITNANIEANIANTEKLTNFSFRITSTSNVEWTKVKWNPSITYKDTANIERTISVPVYYKTFANMVYEGKPYIVPIPPKDKIFTFANSTTDETTNQQNSLEQNSSINNNNVEIGQDLPALPVLCRLVIQPDFSFLKNFNGEITLTVKSNDELLGKRTYNVSNTGIIPDTLFVDIESGKKIWFEYYYSGKIGDP